MGEKTIEFCSVYAIEENYSRLVSDFFFSNMEKLKFLQITFLSLSNRIPPVLV